jgi:hypothetical protein
MWQTSKNACLLLIAGVFRFSLAALQPEFEVNSVLHWSRESPRTR